MNSNIAQAYAVSETCDGAYAANVEAKVLKTDAGYNVEYKVPYAAVEGASAKFSLQVNAASDGKRNCTLHTNADLKDVWQDNSVMENLVFAAADTAATTAEATTDVAKTGVVAMGAVFGLGAVATAAGAILVKGKKEK